MRTDRRGFRTIPVRGAVALVTTVLAVVLLFSFKPADPAQSLDAALPSTAPVVGETPGPTQRTSAYGPPAPTPRTGTGGRASAAPGATPTPEPPTSPPDTGSVSGTFTGDAVDTPYGTVQIALVVQDGQIVDVKELQLPNDRQLSAQISREAGPILRSEVIRAQSDRINNVSGASYTSYGFYLSLQSALQQM